MHDALWKVLKLGLQEWVKILCNIEADSSKFAYQGTDKNTSVVTVIISFLVIQ